MNPAEGVPLQASNMFPGQPAGSTVVHQYTTVNMPAEPPRDHIIWSLWSFFYGNVCCLGLAAVIFSVKARDRKVLGDVSGARSYGSTAFWLNVAASVLVGLIVLIVIIVVSSTAASVSSSYNKYSNYGINYQG